MRKGGGANKGGSFERKICKLLSLWATGMLRDDVFWRTPGSGARSTVRQRRRGISTPDHIGDVQATRREGRFLTNRFVLELKHTNNCSLQPWIYKGTGPLIGFWMKLILEAESVNRRPMLIAKLTNWPTIMLLDEPGLALVQRGCPDFPLVTAKLPDEGVAVVLWDYFLQEVDADVLRRSMSKTRLRKR